MPSSWYEMSLGERVCGVVGTTLAGYMCLVLAGVFPYYGTGGRTTEDLPVAIQSFDLNRNGVLEQSELEMIAFRLKTKQKTQ